MSSRYQNVSDEEASTWKRMYEDGMSIIEISRAVHRCDVTVRRHVNRTDIDAAAPIPVKPLTPITPMTQKRAIQVKRKGETITIENVSITIDYKEGTVTVDAPNAMMQINIAALVDTAFLLKLTHDYIHKRGEYNIQVSTEVANG